MLNARLFPQVRAGQKCVLCGGSGKRSRTQYCAMKSSKLVHETLNHTSTPTGLHSSSDRPLKLACGRAHAKREGQSVARAACRPEMEAPRGSPWR